MNIYPFGVIPDDRYKICIDYKLIEEISDTGIWKLSKKCRNNYNVQSFIDWMEGRRDKPVRETREDIIKQILSL